MFDEKQLKRKCGKCEWNSCLEIEPKAPFDIKDDLEKVIFVPWPYRNVEIEQTETRI